MKNKFLVSILILVATTLVGCGGGGGGGGNPPASGPAVGEPTVRLVDRIKTGFTFSPTPNTNGYVVVKGAEIYVSDNADVWALNFSGQKNAQTAINDPRGLAVSGNDLYYAANPLSAHSNIYIYPNQTSAQVTDIAYNFGSLNVFDSDLYAVDYGSGQVYKFTGKIGSANTIAALTGSSYITSDSNYIYVTKVNGGVGTIDKSGFWHPLGWTGITNPKGIVLAGSYAFVVSQADVNGNNASILRVKLSDGTVETYVDGATNGVWDSSISKGFCGPTGIAANTQDGYLYVINGYCTGAGAVTSNRYTLLRIKI